MYSNQDGCRWHSSAHLNDKQRKVVEHLLGDIRTNACVLLCGPSSFVIRISICINSVSFPEKVALATLIQIARNEEQRRVVENLLRDIRTNACTVTKMDAGGIARPT